MGLSLQATKPVKIGHCNTLNKRVTTNWGVIGEGRLNLPLKYLLIYIVNISFDYLLDKFILFLCVSGDGEFVAVRGRGKVLPLE